MRKILKIIILSGIITFLLAACNVKEESTVGPDSVISLTGYGILNQTAYNFVKAMKTGSTFGSEDKVISFPYEGYWGIEAAAEEKNVFLRAYSNLDYEPEIVRITLNGKGGETDLTDKIGYDDYYEISPEPGAYRIDAVFAAGGFEITNVMYIFVNHDEAWLCEATWMDEESFIKRRDEFRTLMSGAGVTPENSLDWKSVTHNGKAYDNEEWAALSGEIIPDEECPDGFKVMLLHDWLCDNTAFDDYALDTFGTNRADYYGDYSGKYDLYDTRVGVCTDVSEAFMIMCRYNGIPCVSCANNGHQWNAVYINGLWYEMDLTDDMVNKAEDEDLSIFTKNGSGDYTAIDMSNNILEVNRDY